MNKPMEMISHYINLFSGKFGRKLYILYGFLKSRLCYKRKLTILFSKRPGFQDEISRAFRFSQHKIMFEEFSSENIKNADLVVPLYISDLLYLAGHLAKEYPIPIPSVASITLCDDKFLFNQAMAEKGFALYIPEMGGSLTYPYILKKKIGDSSNNIHIISNADQEQLFKDALSSQDYYCQKMIHGTHEYATHIIINNGKVTHSLNIEYVFNTNLPIKRMDKEIYKKICRCPYLDIFSAMLAAVNFEGLCCVNYKVVDNRPLVLEINPRFGMSLCPFFLSFLPD